MSATTSTSPLPSAAVTSTPNPVPSTSRIASPTTSFRVFTPTPKQSTGQGTVALKIAVPVVAGFCLLCIVLLYIRSWIRRRGDGNSSNASVNTRDEDPERKGAVDESPKGPANAPGDGEAGGEAASAEPTSKEAADGLEPLPETTEDEAGQRRQSVRRDSRAISERRRSERRSRVPEQFVDPPKDYRKGRKSSSVIHQEKMAPP